MLLTRLGRKIIQDAYNRNPRRRPSPRTNIDDGDDDSFRRYKGGGEGGEYDVMYHGGHDHGHNEDDGLTEEQRYAKAMYQLKCVTVVGLLFVSAQGIGAYMANSIALFTDCAHLATDLIAFVIGIVALALTQRGVSADYTFGWHRSEILGTIVSLLFLITLTIWLLVEAI